MILLDMSKKNIGVAVTDDAFSSESNILTLLIKVMDGNETYDLSDKTITASFDAAGVETGVLSVIDECVQLPIASNLIQAGNNNIQLNFRSGIAVLEQSPIMSWYVNQSIITSEITTESVDIVTYLIAENNKAITEESERVTAESKREDAETIRVESDIKRKNVRKMELDHQFEYENVLTGKSNSTSIDGLGYVSDPNTYMMVNIGGKSSGGWMAPYISSVTGKGLMSGYSENPILGTTHCRMGCFNNYFNLVDPALTDVTAVSKWARNDKGLPMPIIDYTYTRRSENLDFKSRCFSYDETVFIPCNIQGKAGIRWSMQIDKDNMSIAHYFSTQAKGNLHIIIITLANTPTKFVFAQYPCNLWYIGDAFTDVASGDFTGTDTHTSTSSLAFGLSYADGSWSNVDTCYAVSMPSATMSDADIQTKMINDLVNRKTREQSALYYWDNFWSDYTDQWDDVETKIKSKGMISVHQIAANTYKGGISSGVPTWNLPYIRDAAWVLNSMARIVPTFCKTYLNWWINASSIAGLNGLALDGVQDVQYYNNTDNHAIFLIGIGSLWSELQSVTDFSGVLPQIQTALSYVKVNYNITDKHILAIHNHDYWDEYPTYGGVMNVSLVKYESVIDIFWAYGLKLIAPCFEALGDINNSDYCKQISEALILGLEDYREVNGGLQYAIKTDGTLYSEVVASPGTIYAAYLLDDEQCRVALQGKDLSSRLGLKFLDIEKVMCFSNYRDSTVATKNISVWGPHVPIVAGELARIGDYSLLPVITNSLKFGGWAEDLKVHTSIGSQLVYNQFAINFVWGMAEIVGLCNTLSKL